MGSKSFGCLDDEQFLAELSRRYGDQMGRLELEGDASFSASADADRYVLPRLALAMPPVVIPLGGAG